MRNSSFPAAIEQHGVARAIQDGGREQRASRWRSTRRSRLTLKRTFPVRTGESRVRPSKWITVLRGKRRPIRGTSVTGQHNDPLRPVSENTTLLTSPQGCSSASPRAGGRPGGRIVALKFPSGNSLSREHRACETRRLRLSISAFLHGEQQQARACLTQRWRETQKVVHAVGLLRRRLPDARVSPSRSDRFTRSTRVRSETGTLSRDSSTRDHSFATPKQS